ncbi:MAG: hypothetical protein IT435_04310 [Phycisphaerales bacterium]|nr:hypothetical protein [Phycisphaerales bacterium]
MRFVAAVFFISRDAWKYVGVNGLVIGGLVLLWGAGGALLSVLPASYAIAIVVAEVLRGIDKIRKLRPAAHERREVPCPAAEEYVRRWQEDLRDRLVRIVDRGSLKIKRTLDHNLTTCSDDWRPSRAYRFVYPRRYVRAVRNHGTAYNHLVWQADQIRALALCAAGPRPCAPQIEQWLAENSERDPGMAAFVQSLLARARVSDPLIIEARARAEEENRRRAREWEEREREERERREALARMPRTPVYYAHAPAPRDWEAERAAERRWQSAMATLERRLAALDGAANDLKSRGEYVQLEHVQQEYDRLEAELRQWKKIGRSI